MGDLEDEAKFALAHLQQQLKFLLDEVDREPRKSVLHVQNERIVGYAEKINFECQKALQHKVRSLNESGIFE